MITNSKAGEIINGYTIVLIDKKVSEELVNVDQQRKHHEHIEELLLESDEHTITVRNTIDGYELCVVDEDSIVVPHDGLTEAVDMMTKKY